MRETLGYAPCEADPDVYMKQKVKPDGTLYHPYIVVYVDDILCVDEKLNNIIK